jgi:uncharacterized protein YpmB
MSPKIIAILVAIVLVIVAGMVMTVKKSMKPRDYDPTVQQTAPAKK